MSIGINTNQPSDLSSLNSGSDINTSNQPSDDDADAFAAMVGQNSSDSAEVIVQRDSSEPTLLTPDFEKSEEFEIKLVISMHGKLFLFSHLHIKLELSLFTELVLKITKLKTRYIIKRDIFFLF